MSQRSSVTRVTAVGVAAGAPGKPGLDPRGQDGPQMGAGRGGHHRRLLRAHPQPWWEAAAPSGGAESGPPVRAPRGASPWLARSALAQGSWVGREQPCGESAAGRGGAGVGAWRHVPSNAGVQRVPPRAPPPSSTPPQAAPPDTGRTGDRPDGRSRALWLRPATGPSGELWTLGPRRADESRQSARGLGPGQGRSGRCPVTPRARVLPTAQAAGAMASFTAQRNEHRKR